MSEVTITIPYWLPSSGSVALWMICGVIHYVIMAVTKIQGDLHSDWLDLHGIKSQKGRLTIKHMAVSFILGPIGLWMGFMCLMFWMPQSKKRNSVEAINKRIEADL